MSLVASRHVLFVCVVVGVCAPPGAVYGQALSVGDRVRVQSGAQTWAPDESPDTRPFKTTGTLTGWTSDSLWVDASGQGSIPIHTSYVQKLEVSVGQTNQTIKGMTIGAGIGFGAGFLLAFLAASGGDHEASAAGFGLVYGALGAGAGLVIGGAIGALSSGDVWEEVRVGDLRP